MLTSTQTIDSASIVALKAQQAAFFATGKTKEVAFRKAALKKLLQAMTDYEAQILDAIYKDLSKNDVNAYVTEIAVVNSEIKYLLKHIDKWSKPKRVSTSLVHAPASSYVYQEPYGNVLVIAPWNYPLLLALNPVAGAIAAGNTVILKPSELSVHTSAIMATIIKELFPPEFVAVIEGGVETASFLLTQKWDYVFFTGGVEVGRIVYQAAAKHLTPVTLELGGKSPCIVDEEVHLDYAVKRILWGKYTNCGQTCVAPDYILVNEKVKAALINKLKSEVVAFYGENPQTNPQYARIINRRHFDRLAKMLVPDKIIYGGKTDADDLYISPTFLEISDWETPAMQEEIFGPVLPIMSYQHLEDAIAMINAQPKPLSLYVFSTNQRNIDKVLNSCSFGFGAVNDAVAQAGSHDIPLGGVGDSGIGSYHGKRTFDTFSHTKGVLFKSNLLDMPMRYPNFGASFHFIKTLVSRLL